MIRSVSMFSTLVAVFLFVGFLFVGSASAQTIPPIDLNGYAWSSNVGWISLNCATGGATGNNICATSNYKVTINADRTVTGWAWSSNVGWIKFGGLSSFPAVANTSAINARVVGVYPDLDFEGWARACAGTLPGDCSSMTNSTNTGGWDGWISLQQGGANPHSIGLRATTGMNTNSYAWGSGVIGWIDMFSRVTFNPLSASISGTGCTIAQDANSCNGQLSWTLGTGVTTPRVRNTTTNTQLSISQTGTNESVSLREGANGFAALDNTYTLVSTNLIGTCTPGTAVDGGGYCRIIPGLPPTITFRALRPVVRYGSTATLDWQLTWNPAVDGSCTVTGPGMPVGTVTASAQDVSDPLTGTATFRIICTGTYGTVQAEQKVDVIGIGGEV
jgi:hypothetical protein